MKIKVLTLFPEMYDILNIGILGKALSKNLFDLNISNIRDYSKDKHKKCDDYPFGGGAGMVMTPQPLHDAINENDPKHKAIRIYLSPKGKTLNQKMVYQLSKYHEIMLINGSYEGIDQRIIDNDIDMELSIGDYILTSGDMGSLVIINAVSRYIDGVLGSENSVVDESFSKDLLEYPQYTRPQEFLGEKVPEVLVSGNHKEIEKWRYMQSIEITKKLRPDLLENK